MKYDVYDLAVLGCGPAGFSAAINANIRNKKVIVIGSDICSPPLHKAQKIDNYLGFPGISGAELLDKFMEHFKASDIELIENKAEAINEMDGIYSILVQDQVLQAKSIVISTGIPYKPTFANEEEFLGKGLGYCATCDGPIYKERDVIIISYSSEGESEANFMAEICQKVYYVPLYKTLGSLDKKIAVIDNKPAELIISEFVEGIKMQDGSILKADGVFILGGETAPDRLIPGLEVADNHIKVNRQQETNLPGVFAAGDCTGQPYQVAKSVGEGLVAGLNASKYVSRLSKV
ncbi:MAG: NAD(P)/FAD-dependent oxidoreductase [Syntrophomonadaceae bacterium]|jgi:thioredoxin reductase (NADPH)|nr:NAD(P)/FAD-dependent oxidoreductase [Syntrophomonadaceae bacterium]